MLHDCDQNLIALAEKDLCRSVGEQVQTLGRIPRENDFLNASRSDKRTHRLPRVFIGLGRPDRELVEAAQRIRVFLEVIVLHRAEHTLRLLCRRGVVEVGNLRMRMNQRKILADFRVYRSSLFTCHRSSRSSSSSSSSKSWRVFASGIFRTIASILAFAIIS